MAIKRHAIRQEITTPFLMAVWLLGWMVHARAADPGNELQVGVRSTVFEEPEVSAAKSAPPAVTESGTSYGILAVQLIKSEAGLVKPVDAQRLMALVRHGLDTHGFSPVNKGLRPAILITVQYGRGWLANPYSGDANSAVTADPNARLIANGAVGPEVGAPQVVTGSTKQLMDEKSPGHEANLQKATFEKLYLRVIAWAYPTVANAKARRLWESTMATDDPDHRDLNGIAADMIAAGAPYFGRGTPQPEVDVSRALAAGHVDVGVPKVVDPAPAMPGERRSSQVVAGAPVKEPRKQFEIPAGDAALTLKVFSQQSGEEIIFSFEQVRLIRTRAVAGDLSARVALARMVAGTGLVTTQDEKTGAFAVRREEAR